jgi:phage replication-related protein YjqB (UPF0714/DUF867 family)
VPRPTLTTQPLEITDTGHLTELLYDDGVTDEFLVCAAHGGRVEPGTVEQAIELATRLADAACWATMGYDDEAEEFEQWHPASTAYDPADYPLLKRIVDRGFGTVISLHGLADDGVLVGGGIEPGVRRRVRDHLDAALPVTVETVTSGPYAGVHPENFVNWLAAGERGGLQLEQGPGVRDDASDVVTDVLADLAADGVL